jgi:two-component system cell cycle sensor histidine kinase PleC
LDEAAILREIARRIRDGTDAATPPAPQAPPSPGDDRAHDIMTRLAHELRTPISAMTAAAELMASERLGAIGNPKYLGYAEDIAASGRHALSVITRVLQEWQQPETQRPLEFVQLDLNRLAERLVSVLQPLARERRQTITARLEAKLPNVIADATSVRQILLNLLTNAIRYADTGSDIAVVTAFVLDGPVTLQVADAGPGMTAAQLAAARGEVSTAPARGTGLGLPLVRQLAAANGAAFAIDSGPSSPTTTTLTFSKDKVVPV